jgi:hypothetical protein
MAVGHARYSWSITRKGTRFAAPTYTYRSAEQWEGSPLITSSVTSVMTERGWGFALLVETTFNLPTGSFTAEEEIPLRRDYDDYDESDILSMASEAVRSQTQAMLLEVALESSIKPDL